MSFRVALRAVVIWLAILALAIVNGSLREKVLIPILGVTPGMVLSGVMLSCMILAVAYLFLAWLDARASMQLALVGAGWLALTLVFEFTFGLFRGNSLSEILEAYTFKDGNIWPVVLLVTAVSPWLAAKLRGLI